MKIGLFLVTAVTMATSLCAFAKAPNTDIQITTAAGASFPELPTTIRQALLSSAILKNAGFEVISGQDQALQKQVAAAMKRESGPDAYLIGMTVLFAPLGGVVNGGEMGIRSLINLVGGNVQGHVRFFALYKNKEYLAMTCATSYTSRTKEVTIFDCSTDMKLNEFLADDYKQLWNDLDTNPYIYRVCGSGDAEDRSARIEFSREPQRPNAAEDNYDNATETVASIVVQKVSHSSSAVEPVNVRSGSRH